MGNRLITGLVMKKLLLTFLIILFSLTSNVVWSADYNKGLTAYYSGDYATALREWKPLAEQGDASAQYNLGVMYDNGYGVPQDDKTAVKWYTLAAEQDDAKAQFNLGVMYRKGYGVTQDDKTAVKWYTLAAEQGDAGGQYSLGVMYYNEEGVLRDYVYAHMWANISASNGNENAIEFRDFLANEIMTSADISAAQKLTRECVAKNYKGC